MDIFLVFLSWHANNNPFYVNTSISDIQISYHWELQKQPLLIFEKVHALWSVKNGLHLFFLVMESSGLKAQNPKLMKLSRYGSFGLGNFSDVQPLIRHPCCIIQNMTPSWIDIWFLQKRSFSLAYGLYIMIRNTEN